MRAYNYTCDPRKWRLYVLVRCSYRHVLWSTLLVDGASSFLYSHIVLSVVIEGRCSHLNLGDVIWNTVCERSISWHIVEPQVHHVGVCAVIMASVCVVRVSKLGGAVSTVCHPFLQITQTTKYHNRGLAMKVIKWVCL